jgi:hypothetical protein
VTENLVLYLDAGNPDSYPGSGTTWYDLSAQSNNCNLVNSPIFSSNNGGYLTFNGLDEYGEINNSADFDFGTEDFTVEYWANCQNISKTYQLIGGNHVGGIGGGWYIYGKNGLGFVGFGYGTNLNSLYGPSQNVWYHIVISRVAGEIIFYTNNVAEAGQTFVDNVTSANNLWIATISHYGYLTNGTYHWDGHIAQMRIYKGKGLSAEEVSTNFNADRARYGI